MPSVKRWAAILTASLAAVALWMRRVQRSGAASRRTWSLETQGGSEALLDYVGGIKSPGVMRVTIAKLGGHAQAWHVKLQQHSYAIVSGTRYSVSFRARAARPRPVGCAMGHDREPWEALGEYHEHVVTKEWTTFRGAFTGLAADPQARLFFDLAKSDAWVDLTDVVVRDETHGRELRPHGRAPLGSEQPRGYK